MFRLLFRWQLIADISLALLVLIVALWAEIRSAGDGASLGAPLSTVAVAILFALAVAVRRLRPALSLALAWLAAILQMLCLLPVQPSDIAVLIVLYTAVAYGSRRTFWAALASGLSGGLIAAWYFIFVRFPIAESPSSGRSLTSIVLLLGVFFFPLLLSCTAGALMRAVRRARRAHQARLRAEADATAELERGRIARDVHDIVAHSLAVIVAQADGARYAVESDATRAMAVLETISRTGRSALADVRRVLAQLRHDPGDGPQPTLADLDELFTRMREAGLALRIENGPLPDGLSAVLQLTIYRILQEALTNALRHGGNGAVTIRLVAAECMVSLEVRSPLVSRGARTSRGARVPAGAGHGLVGMTERAILIGGQLTAGAMQNEFVVTASFPLEVFDE